MEIQLGAVKRIHGLLKTEAESYEGLLGEGHVRALGKGPQEGCACAGGLHGSPGVVVLLDASRGPCLMADPQPGLQHHH
jgi:hypothetical protein